MTEPINAAPASAVVTWTAIKREHGAKLIFTLQGSGNYVGELCIECHDSGLLPVMAQALAQFVTQQMQAVQVAGASVLTQLDRTNRKQ